MASLMASSSSSLLSARRSRAVVGPARRAAVAPVSGRKASRGVAPCFAMIRQYPDPDFMAQVAKDFPEMGVAEPDEVRCLLAQGWTWLDVRPTLEYEDAGKTKGSVNIPIKNSKKKFVDGKKTFEKTPNPDWLAMVQKKFPNKEQKIMIGCSDGQAYSIDALEALDEAGYVNLVGVAGGYYEWFRYFDNKMIRRNLGEYQEKYDGAGQDSCGIHASGAGFTRSDSIVGDWAPPTY